MPQGLARLAAVQLHHLSLVLRAGLLDAEGVERRQPRRAAQRRAGHLVAHPDGSARLAVHERLCRDRHDVRLEGHYVSDGVCAHPRPAHQVHGRGPHRVRLGRVWYGAPQWQIEASGASRSPRTWRGGMAIRGLPRRTSARSWASTRPSSTAWSRPRNTVSPAVYKPVPANYESRITPELKRILEYPGGSTAAAPQSEFPQYADDNLAKMKASYAEAGGTRSNTRYGWLRTRA